MGRHKLLVIHCQFLHRPGTPYTREETFDAATNVRVIKTNDGPDTTPENDLYLAECLLEYRDDLRAAVGRKKKQRRARKRSMAASKM